MSIVLTAPADTITLTTGQDNALNAFVQFLCDPTESVFVLEGYSGTGKSTLIRELIDRLPNYLKTLKLINPSAQELTVQLTATTNKAAETFSLITGMEVLTIHSFLGLRVSTDYRTKKSELIPSREFPEEGYLLFIDEASYVDSQLLQLIFKQTKKCKIVFIGDRAQLINVNSIGAPVFLAGFKGAMLTEVMRQMINGVPQINPITEMATQFRETVNTGIWTPFKPDGEYVVHLPRDQFEDAILAEFTRKDWKFKDSKVLAWTNNCVIAYNNAIRNHVSGDPELQQGDYAICNKYVSRGKHNVKTDAMVYISEMGGYTECYGVPGNYVEIDSKARYFLPANAAAKKAREKEAKDQGDFGIVREINEEWIDLRAAYAQTVNKSQGSTYDRVFIDLDDIGKCNNGDSIARMMYVAPSRARKQVIMTGDFG